MAPYPTALEIRSSR